MTNTKITKFDRTNLRDLRQDIDAALKAVADKHGISIRAGNARFMPQSASMKLELGTIGEGGQVIDTSAEEFKVYAPLYGLSADDLGKKFKSFDGCIYTITGCRPKSRRFPIIAARADGRAFNPKRKMIATSISRLIGLSVDESRMAVSLLMDSSVHHLAATKDPTTWVVCDISGRKTERAICCPPNVARAVNAIILKRN